jgi:hypothetical protein
MSSDFPEMTAEYRVYILKRMDEYQAMLADKQASGIFRVAKPATESNTAETLVDIRVRAGV